jgi:hypothetical protein
VSLVKPTVYSGSRGAQENLFCNFWTFLQVSINFRSLHYFLKLKIIENDLKPLGTVLGQIRPEAEGLLGAVAAGHHSLTARGHGPAASSARSALPPGAPSAPPPWSPRTERPGRRGHQKPISGLGAEAPAVGAPARYKEPAEQHDGGEGSLGRWRDSGVAESSSVDGVRR